MKPGHPFETKARDELRAQQRLALRLVPDWLVELYAPTRPVGRPSGDTGLLENELRALADDVEAELNDLPQRWEERVRQEVLFKFLQDNGTEIVLSQRGRITAYVFNHIIESMRRPVHDAEMVGEPAAEVAAPLMRYLHLLVWADDLADDGYRDPRLPQLTESSE